MPRMNERQLLQRVRQQLQRCAGWDADKIASDREDALNYYLQRARGDEVAGRSRVVSGDLSAMVEATMAQMMGPMGAARIAEFGAFGESDVTQARLESAAVHHVLMRANNGFIALCEAVKDALLLRNGFPSCWVEEKKRTQTRTYEVDDELAAGLITDPDAESSELVSFDGREARVKHTYVSRQFNLEAVPPENFLYLENWHSLDLQPIPICAERHVDSRSDLIERFPKAKAKIERLAAYTRDHKPDSTARDPGRYTRDAVSVDKSQDELEWFEVYVLYDSDGDGISERHRLAVAGKHQNSLLEDVEVPLVKYCTGTAIIMPHRMTGISMYDKLRQQQDKTTGLERALMDNVNANNKNKLFAMAGAVDQDDLDDGRINNNVRVYPDQVDDVRKAAMPMPVNDMTQGILSNLEYQARKRTEMGGAALDLQSANMQLNERMGSEGLDRAYSVMESLAAFFTQMIANSMIRNLYLLAHATLREYWPEPLQVEIDGKWLQANPAEWPQRDAVLLNIGKTPGERARRSAVLEKGAQWQVQLATSGLEDVLVDATTFYRTITEYYRVNDIPNPEHYWIDPESPRSQQAQAAMREQQARDAQARKALMRQAVSLEQMRTAEQHWQHTTELQFKYWRETLVAEIKEAEIAGRAVTELVKPKEQVSNGSTNGTKAGKSGNGQGSRAGNESGPA